MTLPLILLVTALTVFPDRILCFVLGALHVLHIDISSFNPQVVSVKHHHLLQISAEGAEAWQIM